MWKEFINKTKNREPQHLILEAISHFENPFGYYSLDLGCGSGVDSLAMRDAGFFVHAIDGELEAIKLLENKHRIFPVHQNIENFEFSTIYHIVVAWNSLPFLKKKDAKKVIEDIKKSLLPGGIFVFSLFGKHDGFVKNKKAISFSFKELMSQLKGFNMVHFSEKEEEYLSVAGEMKHWHLFTGIIQKPKIKSLASKTNDTEPKP